MPTFSRWSAERGRATVMRVRPRVANSRTLRTQASRPHGRFYFRTTRGVANFTIAGTTLDATGAPLGGCTVDLFRSGDHSFVATTTSDGAGAYTLTIGDNAGYFYVVAYKAGAPDVFGTTENTLAAV